MCDICHYQTDENQDVLLYGEWMQAQNIRVHYYCLLLSTNLPQRCKDDGGILGFRIIDIRKEIRCASERNCMFCAKSQASIRCYKCKQYFHLKCGRQNSCQFEFCDEFRSYCCKCMPLDTLQQKWLNANPPINSQCFICQESMGLYSSSKWIYAGCCGSGFVHNTCMQEYSLSAGYYLRCLWCGDTSFRDHVRLRGIFVPDRDAQWERHRYAFRELHRGHKQCDMPTCHCPRGRDYITAKWSIMLCALCGSVGAHNPSCIPGKEKSIIPVTSFKCATCAEIGKRVKALHEAILTNSDNNRSLMIYKCTDRIVQTTEDENGSSASSGITVLEQPLLKRKTDKTNPDDISMHIVLKSAKELTSYSSKSQKLRKSCDQSNEIVAVNISEQELTANVINETTETEHLNKSEISAGRNILGKGKHKAKPNHTKKYDFYEFGANQTCIGVCRVVIDTREPRFQNVNLEDHEIISKIINQEDVVDRWENDGIFDAIDRLIEKCEEEDHAKENHGNQNQGEKLSQSILSVDNLIQFTSVKSDEELSSSEERLQMAELNQMSEFMQSLRAQQRLERSLPPPLKIDRSLYSESVIPTQLEPMLEFTPGTQQPRTGALIFQPEQEKKQLNS